MKYEIQAKPTMYEGRLYRSRLEARWAAFFTLCGYPFEYEPEVFADWLPDFVINANGSIIYVEVKPNYDGMCDAFDKCVKAADHALVLLACAVDQPAYLFHKRIGKRYAFSLDQQDLWIKAANEVMYLKQHII